VRDLRSGEVGVLESGAPAACQAPFCVFPAYRIVGTTGTYGSSATSNNSVPWAVVLSSYLDQTFPVDLQRFAIE